MFVNYSGSVTTSMLAVFNLLKIISLCKYVWNVLNMCCKSISKTEGSSYERKNKDLTRNGRIRISLYKGTLQKSCTPVAFLHQC